jgi:predicted enzyme related to lactoylglutathione lyase
VPETKTAKNRMHVDLDAEDPDAELDRLLALGATVVDDRRIDDHWVALADPEGNEFCLMF